MKDPVEYLNRLTPPEREAIRLELKRLDERLAQSLIRNVAYFMTPLERAAALSKRDEYRSKLGLR